MMHFTPDIDALARATAGVPDPRRIDGRVVAKALRAQVEDAVRLLVESRGIRPRLAVVMVGDDPASEIYVRHKIRACEETGIESERHLLPADATSEQLLGLLTSLDEDAAVHGILLQLPLPPHMDELEAIQNIVPEKDVDGFHPANLGRLMAWIGTLEPCTPRGVMTLLRAYGIPIRGKNTLVIGRSMNVGRPMAQMLVRADATVTVCHRHSTDLAEHVRRAELLVVATGVAGLVKGEWIRREAVVVDIGITRVGKKLVGDVEFDTAYERVAAITPVPGGVGPMTVATLMENTIRATCLQHRIRIEDDQIHDLI